jgi:hypothetical protein
LKDTIIQKLYKSRKDDLKALGEHSDWASKTLQHENKPNAAHINWLSNAVKKNNGVLTPEHKTSIEHYASMYHLPQVKNANLNGQSLEDGLNTLQNAETSGQKKAPEKSLVSEKGSVLQPTKSGKSWYNLGVAGCKEEGQAGKHCGNTPALNEASGRQHERVISLREPSEHPGKLKQHLTFVNNNGYITEAKGKGNTKPSSVYHSDIIDLLEHPQIKGFVGGGFLPGSNFDPEDVQDPIQKKRLQELESKKPGFFNPDIKDLHETIQDDPFLSLRVTNKQNAQNNTEVADDSYEAHAKLINNSDWDWVARATLAKNPNLHPDHQAKLASDVESTVRASLARNPNLHPSLQSGLLKDKNEAAIRAMLEHPKLLPEFRDEAARQPNLYFQGAFARNPSLGPEHQAMMVAHPDRYIRQNLAENPNLHPSLQGQLIDNDQDEDIDVLSGLAKNPNLHPDNQKKLVNKHNNRINFLLSKNTNIHPDIQNKLFEGREDIGTHALSKNPNLHPDVANKIEQHLIQKIKDAQVIDKNGNVTPAYEGAEADQQNAADELNTLRKNKLINSIKSSDDPEFIKQYQFSHNAGVSESAKIALKNILEKNK